MKIIIFFIVLFVANVIQAITGFAGTLLAMPVSILLLGVNKAKVILNIMTFLSCLCIALKERKYIRYSILGKIILFMGIGMAVGVLLFENISLDFLLLLYGILIIAIACKNIFGSRKKKKVVKKSLMTVSLLAAGVIHGMFVSGGALLVIYATSVLKEKKTFRATIAAVWVILNGGLMVSDYIHNCITGEVIKIIVLGIVPLFVAIAIGNKIHDQINQKIFLTITYILLLISGLSIIF